MVQLNSDNKYPTGNRSSTIYRLGCFWFLGPTITIKMFF